MNDSRHEPGDVRHVDGVPYVLLIDHDGERRWFGPGWKAL